MKRRDAIFDRLALKEKLFINQQMRNLGALHIELQKIEDMRHQLWPKLNCHIKIWVLPGRISSNHLTRALMPRTLFRL